MRKRSKAYKPPSKKRKVRDEPTFGPDILSGESELNAGRVGLWGTQKRGKLATAGILAGTGGKWGDQQKALGMSANEAVASANHMLDLEARRKGPYQWLHLFAFSIGGIDAYDPQNPKNFVVGSAHANYYHQIFESAPKSLAKQHNVVVTCEAMEPVSAPWRIYRKLRYTFRLSGGSVPVADGHARDRHPPHAARARRRRTGAEGGDPRVARLPHRRVPRGVRQACERVVSSSPRARLPSLSDELSMVVVDAEEEEDEQMAWALTDSVQLIARSHGVAAHYRVGHADGKGSQLLDPVGLRSRRRQPRPRAGGGIPPGART